MSDPQAAQTTNELPTPRTLETRHVSDVVSVGEAAVALGVNERAIRRAIQRGDLEATKQGRSFQITLEALDHFRTVLGQSPRVQPKLRLVEPVPEDPGEFSPFPIPVPGMDEIGRILLPAPVTLFVGRHREIPELKALLLRDDVRFITLTGPGGVGKTRLALQAARDVATEFLDGAAFVPLASVQDPDLVPASIGKALGVMDGDGHSPAARLTAALRERQMLLILDNFEHLAHMNATASSSVIDLLTSCPGIKILVTSRSLLRLSGEHAFVVPR